MKALVLVFIVVLSSCGRPSEQVVVSPIVSDSVELASKNNENAIVPRFPVSFGMPFDVEGIFIEKPRTYYDQNVISAPYLFKASKCNGVKLPSPVIMEPFANKLLFEKRGILTLRAYESIYEFGEHQDWNVLPSQFSYYIHHRIILKTTE